MEAIMKKQLFGLLTASLLMSGVTHAHMMPKHHAMTPFSSERLHQELKLDKSQIETVKAINEKYSAIYKTYRDQINPIIQEIEVIKNTSATPDYDKLRVLFNRLNPIHTEIKLAQVKHEQDIKLVLTPQQRDDFDKIKKQKRDSAKQLSRHNESN